MSNTLNAVFAGLLEDASSRFLALSPHRDELLAPLAGKLIALRLLPLDLRLVLAPTESALTLLPDHAGEVDATLSGTPLAFARMGLSERPQRGLFAGEVTLEGDTSVARRFQALFRHLDITWEALLARYTGAGLASLIVGGLRDSHAWRVELVDNLRQDTLEYLQEESRELPAAAEGEGFLRAVDVLRADADRLTARIERLEKLIAAKPLTPTPLPKGEGA
ncbi:SCP2 domain-containing protein [Methylococcus sp. EFPC2]|uniref:ubiquinone biosynthesis accessory factor UbiJ n=1 Tax=Methylococcus sp. EFPC2 TaxID=2812648 RepID=UPI001966FECE|nr:SCP2 sterol-binding domain-containing protein [Methylococcus sp. EFPC2]QSA96333.1 SCP2 sterol-binding domain-containing protein [Methylococcus sp. EFPC2]